MTGPRIETRNRVQLVQVLADSRTVTPNVNRDRVDLRKKIIYVVTVLAAVIRSEENRRFASKLRAALDQMENASQLGIDVSDRLLIGIASPTMRVAGDVRVAIMEECVL